MKKSNLLKYGGSVFAFGILFIGLCFFANNTLPGTFLYPLKIHVNESVIGMTKKTAYDKATYSIYLANKRLGELDQLKKDNKLTDKILNDVKYDFNQQTILAQEYIFTVGKEEGLSAIKTLSLNESLFVAIEDAKNIFDIDRLEIFPEGEPVPVETSTKTKK